jgi:hypothetical protein
MATKMKWKIATGFGKNEFYEEIKRYEDMGYELLPESFNRSRDGTYAVLMRFDEF